MSAGGYGGRWARRTVAAIAGLALALAASLLMGTPRARAACGGFEDPCSNDTSQQFVYGSVQRHDTPNDPNYDQAEPDTQQPPGNRSSNFFDERFDLFGFPSQLTPTAVYADGPHAGKPMVAGFNAAGAWKAERGRPDVVVAILDTGIDWSNTGLRDQIHLNTSELPYPQVSGPALESGVDCSKYTPGTYDANGDGVVNVEDYACDPAVSVVWSPGRTGPAGLVTGQDLIHAFGDCQVDEATHAASNCGSGAHYDNDGNGYANDIAGWNFFDNTNDPTDRSSYFAAHHHGTDRAADAVEKGNDAQGSIGVCSHCQFTPLRVWDTFVSDGNTFGQAMVYAADNGVKVIEGADGSLYHSAFAEAASQYAYDKGLVQTYSGDDLNTANHNYPGNYGHAMLIQGTVTDVEGLGQNSSQWVQGEGLCGATGQPVCLGSNAPVGTFFRGANTTQYGGKSSISFEGPTGSVNTSKASGAAALVVSAGLDKGITLHPDETRELLEQTAERVTTGNTHGSGVPDPGADPNAPADQQWTTHFGWGRADVGAAVGAVIAGHIPPEAAIDSPDWFAPLTGSGVDITGLARARLASGGQFHWKLMWGPGLAPTSWTTVREGDASGTLSDFGSIDLNAVRSALANYVPPPDPGGPVFAPGSNPFQGQFTVQLEVTDDQSAQSGGLTGIDRRVFTAVSDPTLRSGYPKRMGTGGEAPLRYADLNGDNVPELVVPTEDGVVHAYEPDGSELTGWPVHTQPEWPAAHCFGMGACAGAGDSGHSGSAGLAALGLPPEPPRAPLIADLSGTGHPEVITAAGTHMYAWHRDGTPVAGWPVSSDPSFCGPALETDDVGNKPGDHPKCGFLASPALAHLEGYDKPPDIVESSLDGHLYAWHTDGSPVAGFPVALIDPAQVKAGTQMIAESINDPAIMPDPGGKHDDVVVASNEEYGAPSQSGDVSFAGVTSSAAGGSGRLYAIDGSTGHIMPGWPVAMPGIIQNVLPFIGPGQDAAIANIGGQTQIIASTTGGALEALSPSGQVITTYQQQGSEAFGPSSDATDRSGALNLFESASIGDLLGTGTPDVVKYEVSLSQAANLLLVGQNYPYNHLIAAYEGASGATLPSFPTVTDDYQFLSASNIAKVATGPTASGPTNQVLTGTGLGLLHAYDGATGQDVGGFPKVTGGWLFSPATLSVDGRVADITREGYLFEWQVGQTPCQPTGAGWPTFRHDPHDSGNFNHDGTPPAAPAEVSLTGLGGNSYKLSYTAPGNDGFCGTASHYVTSVDGSSNGAPDLGTPPAGGTKMTQTITLPPGAQQLRFQADDGANGPGVPGNLGAPATLAVPGAGQTTTGGGTATGLPPASTPATQGAGAGSGSGGGSGGAAILPKLGGLFPTTPNAALARCLATRTPASRLTRRGAHVARRGLTLRGSSSERACDPRHRGHVVKVVVSIARSTGRLCRFVARNGRLSRAQSCHRGHYLRARGTTHWTLRLAHLPSPGSYQIFVRGVDAAGRVERRNRHRNFLRLRLR